MATTVPYVCTDLSISDELCCTVTQSRSIVDLAFFPISITLFLTLNLECLFKQAKIPGYHTRVGCEDVMFELPVYSGVGRLTNSQSSVSSSSKVSTWSIDPLLSDSSPKVGSFSPT